MVSLQLWDGRGGSRIKALRGFNTLENVEIIPEPLKKLSCFRNVYDIDDISKA